MINLQEENIGEYLQCWGREIFISQNIIKEKNAELNLIKI